MTNNLPVVPDRLDSKDRELAVKWLREMADYLEKDAQPPWFCCLDKIPETIPMSPFITYRLMLSYPWGG